MGPPDPCVSRVQNTICKYDRQQTVRVMVIGIAGKLEIFRLVARTATRWLTRSTNESPATFSFSAPVGVRGAAMALTDSVLLLPTLEDKHGRDKHLDWLLPRTTGPEAHFIVPIMPTLKFFWEKDSKQIFCAERGCWLCQGRS